MLFTKTFVFAAFAACVSAQANPFTLNATTFDAGFTAGTPVDITWSPTSSGTVTLLLKQGVSTNLDTVSTIVSNTANSGSFTWTPSTSLVQGSDYAFEIVDDTNENSVNYSQEFTINSSNTVSASTQSTSATSSAVSSSKSASSSASASSSSASAASTSGVTSTSSSASGSSSGSASTTSSAASSSITSVSSKNATTTLATKTSSSSSSSGTASATVAVETGAGMRLKLSASMLALVGAVMVAL